MSSREIMQYDQSNGSEKKIGDYLCKFDVCLVVVVEIFTLTNIFIFVCREDESNDYFLEEFPLRQEEI